MPLSLGLDLKSYSEEAYIPKTRSEQGEQSPLETNSQYLFSLSPNHDWEKY